MSHNSHAIEVNISLTKDWDDYSTQQRIEMDWDLQDRLPILRGNRDELGPAIFHYVHWTTELKDKDGNVIDVIYHRKILLVQKVSCYKNRKKKETQCLS